MDYQFRLGETAEIVLGSLLPEVPFQLAVLDKLKQEVLVRDVVSPKAEETERIVLRLQGETQDLTGLVVDVQDRPIAGASVTAMFGGQGGDLVVHGQTRRTDDRGHFRFEGGYPTGREFTLKVSCRGYAKTKREGVAITKGMQPIHLRMLPGHDVTVTFVDRNGKRLPVSWGRVAGDTEARRTCPELGVLLFMDLAAGPLVFETDVSGRTYRLQHDPAVSKAARFVLPVMGRCRVEVPRSQRHKWSMLRVKITARSDGQAFESRFQSSLDQPNLKTRELLLLPGEYRVEVLLAETRDGRKVLHPAKPMTVRAGALSRCRFGQR